MIAGAALAFALATSCGGRRQTISDAGDIVLGGSKQPVAGTKTRVQGVFLGYLLGGVFGGAIGALYAETVIKERQEYANANAYLEAYSRQLDVQLANVRSFNAVLEAEMVTLTTRGRELDAAIGVATAVNEKVGQEISLQRSALETAGSEGVEQSAAVNQKARLAQLEAEETRLLVHIERLSALRSGAQAGTRGSFH